MSTGRALRGSCHCGRNQYVVRVPTNATRDAQIIFDTDSSHRKSSATPLSAFLRVPITWYHSQTFPFFADETRSAIRRTYSHPEEQHVMRHFCGFCGTPISYFTERPRSEADYIQVTLGSLLTEDLHDLEDMGLLPTDDEEEDVMDMIPSTKSALSETPLIERDIKDVPWFNSMISGSQLGNLCTTRVVRESRDGTARVEWEITEWTDDNDDDAGSVEPSPNGKRKRGNTEQESVAPARSSTH